MFWKNVSEFFLLDLFFLAFPIDCKRPHPKILKLIFHGRTQHEKQRACTPGLQRFFFSKKNLGEMFWKNVSEFFLLDLFFLAFPIDCKRPHPKILKSKNHERTHARTHARTDGQNKLVSWYSNGRNRVLAHRVVIFSGGGLQCNLTGTVPSLEDKLASWYSNGRNRVLARGDGQKSTPKFTFLRSTKMVRLALQVA